MVRWIFLTVAMWWYGGFLTRWALIQGGHGVVLTRWALIQGGHGVVRWIPNYNVGGLLSKVAMGW